jgi:hypothetical protein
MQVIFKTNNSLLFYLTSRLRLKFIVQKSTNSRKHLTLKRRLLAAICAKNNMKVNFQEINANNANIFYAYSAQQKCINL